MHDEDERIRAAAAGDRRAFDALVRAKREQVVRIAYQVTGDWEDAVDVSQGVFLRLWKGLGSYDPRRRFDTWLYRITMNAAIDWVRSRGPQRTLQPLPDEAAEPAAPERETSASVALDLSELRAAFNRLAARLAPKQRMAFALREIEGLSTGEVARAMNVTESTVRNHLLQARRALREGLEREYPGLVPVARRRDDGDGDEGGA
jgi:RNA polymerase sigma-70 factor (ECF subfamily)